MYNHAYANNDVIAVTKKTCPDSTFLTSPTGRQVTHTAGMTMRLKAADPTMVDGPSGPANIPSMKTSMTERRISGAELPRAMRDKFATVAFQTSTFFFLYMSCSPGTTSRTVLCMAV